MQEERTDRVTHVRTNAHEHEQRLLLYCIHNASLRYTRIPHISICKTPNEEEINISNGEESDYYYTGVQCVGVLIFDYATNEAPQSICWLAFAQQIVIGNWRSMNTI